MSTVVNYLSRQLVLVTPCCLPRVLSAAHYTLQTHQYTSEHSHAKMSVTNTAEPHPPVKPTAAIANGPALATQPHLEELEEKREVNKNVARSSTKYWKVPALITIRKKFRLHVNKPMFRPRFLHGTARPMISDIFSILMTHSMGSSGSFCFLRTRACNYRKKWKLLILLENRNKPWVACFSSFLSSSTAFVISAVFSSASCAATYHATPQHSNITTSTSNKSENETLKSLSDGTRKWTKITNSPY